jgi:hypothetical protein
MDKSKYLAPFGNVVQLLPVDSVLNFELKNGLSRSLTDDVDVSPDIWNLNEIKNQSIIGSSVKHI